MENTFDFGLAIKALKIGAKVARKGWDGKSMFLYYVPSTECPTKTEIAAKEWDKDGMVPHGAYIAMKTVQGNSVRWFASLTDILAEDWVLFGT